MTTRCGEMLCGESRLRPKDDDDDEAPPPPPRALGKAEYLMV